MNIPATSRPPKSISSAFPNKLLGTVAEVLFLVVIGMVAIALHSKLRIPMQLPGRQGILYLAIVVIGRGMSRYPFAGTLISAGSAALLVTPWLGFHEPLMPVVYVCIGILLDLFCFLWSILIPGFLSVSLACAMAWMCIPLIRFLLTLLTGITFSSFRHGLAWPVCTHFVFGFAGGLLGMALLKILTRYIRK